EREYVNANQSEPKSLDRKGHSFRDGAPVLDVIGRHLMATLLLMGSSTVIAIAIGTWIGVRGAIKRYSIFDYMATVGEMVALS
ncbi:hypothetical protein ACC758_39100, partial [Rhizobium ruizarguesonis]